jgi:MscS family membrane protein
MMQEFLLAIGESEKKPERMKDAVRCLDLSGLEQSDPAAAEKQGPTLANQLEQIVDALLNVYGKSLDEIPTEPALDAVQFPTEGEVQLTLARSADGLWRISAATVAAIPELLATVRGQAATQPEEVADVPPGFRSARATMRTFLEAMAEGDSAAAAECLDLSHKPPATRAEIGSDLAERLLFVMDRIEVVVYLEIPDKPNGEPFSWYIGEQGRIELARQESGELKGRWLFTTATVDSIESLFKAFEDKPRLEALQSVSFSKSPRRWLMEKIPPSWKGELLSVQLWQWLGIVLLLVVSYIVHRLAFAVFCAAARPFGRSEHIELSETHISLSMRPLGMLVMVATWWLGLKLLLIPTAILVYVWPALKFVMTSVAVWAMYRLIDLVGDYFAARAKQTLSRLDDVLVPLVRKTAKIVVIAIGIIFILKAVGVEEKTVNKVFAGLGLGGLAFALAAQDSIKNFFGSVTVVLDRPFQVGDWVKIGGSVEGTVESVGLRSSRVRTFYNSQITVPNSEIMNATVDNMGRRRYRRISCKLGVTYSTKPEQLEAFTEAIRELIRRHPYTRKDYYHVYVNEFGASSINILLYCFHETPDWGTELRERHRLFLDIVRVAHRLGVEFAFPTQTVHLHHESSPPAVRPSPPQSVPADPTQAQECGRAEAAAVVRATLGDGSEKPPPVVI